GISAPAIVCRRSIKRISAVPELNPRRSAGFVERLYRDSRARAIVQLESAGWPLDRLGAELDCRGVSAVNVDPWTTQKLVNVLSSARRLGLIRHRRHHRRLPNNQR